MSQASFPLKKAVPVIVIAWVLSLVTAVALIYFMPVNVPAVGSDKIVDGAVITTKLADGSVSSAKILDGTLTAIDLADGSVITAKIANGAVTASKIADGSVNSSKIANSSIITSKIADNAIVTIKLADGSVTSAKILDGTIIAADLASGSVTAIKIADGAITTEKIADGAVTNAKLASGAIPFSLTQATGVVSTTSTTFEDMPNMSVNITVTRNSTLLILFSTQAEVTSGNYLYMRAMVNSTAAYPVSDYIFVTSNTYWNAHSFNFYQSVTAGTYTVKMQWRTFLGSSTGSIDERTLTVIALPE
jgi:molybdopterin-binding protein